MASASDGVQVEEAARHRRYIGLVPVPSFGKSPYDLKLFKTVRCRQIADCYVHRADLRGLVPNRISCSGIELEVGSTALLICACLMKPRMSQRRKALRAYFHRCRVDKICCCAYTLAVVLRPSGLVVKGKSSGPGTKKDGSGRVKSGRNGAPAPQSRASLSAVTEDAVHSSG
jgi:hypothetical protein